MFSKIHALHIHSAELTVRTYFAFLWIVHSTFDLRALCATDPQDERMVCCMVLIARNEGNSYCCYYCIRDDLQCTLDDSAGQKASAHAICNCWTLLVECACQPLDDATAPPPPVYCERPKGGMGFISIRVWPIPSCRWIDI